MSLEPSTEKIEAIDTKLHATSRAWPVVALVVAVVILGASVVIAGKRFVVETSSVCTTTLSGSDVKVSFEGPHAATNCSQWVTDFNEQSDAWSNTWSYERHNASSSSIVCSLVRDKDTARVSDSGLGLVGSLACLSLETDGWQEITTSDS